MKKRFTILMALMLTMTLMVGIFTGCGSSSDEEETKTTSTKEEKKDNTSDSKESTSTEDQSVEAVYPLDGDRSITYWTTAFIHPEYPTQADTPLMKEMFERTGITVEFIHQQAPEAFSLMVASGDLPDVYKHDLVRKFPGGPSAALEQGIAVPLNDYLEYAPNLVAYLEANPDIDKMVKTDDGQYYCFPFVRGGDYLTTFIGPILRKDWLDDLGLEVPTTVDEWEVVLKAFKDEKGAAAPFTGELNIIQGTNPFVGAYGASFGMHLEDGEIVYGPVKDGYKDFLHLWNKWYEMGLIDPDVGTVDKNTVAAQMTAGGSGAAMGHTGSRMGAWLTSMKDDPSYDLVGAPYPVLNEGDYPEFGQSQFPFFGFGVSISPTCEDIEAAMRFLDYGYSEEGHMLYNFGIEGESYEMVDGYPTYTDHVLNNPDGIPSAQMLMGYVQSSYNGPLIQDVRYMEQYAQYQQQKDSIVNWKDTNNTDHLMPPVTLNEEEASVVGAIESEITAYKDEFFLKAVFGVIDIDEEWDKYIETINKMGVEEMLATYEVALDRYNNR
jgi:putative aldouronate transport system substrate-binding protein